MTNPKTAVEPQVYRGVRWRVVKSFCQGRPEEVTPEQAKQELQGYYPDVKGALNHMWSGGKCQTAGHDYWIEKERVDGENNRRNGS